MVRGWQQRVLVAGLALEGVRHGASSGTTEVLLLASLEDPDALGLAARRLAGLEGVVRVSCSALGPGGRPEPRAGPPGGGNYL